jgi:hypothetical protein
MVITLYNNIDVQLWFPNMNDRVQLSHVYFETRVYGKYLRVHAIDPDSGQEAMATGLRSMGEASIKNNAKRKLEYILTRKRREAASPSHNWRA